MVLLDPLSANYLQRAKKFARPERFWDLGETFLVAAVWPPWGVA